MAGSKSQKELLTLIRDVSTEKSQGERRIVNLKRQIEELRAKLDFVNTELKKAKSLKECTEQDLKGYEVELAMNESSIQTLEGRISLLQGEVSTLGSDLEALKVLEEDEFIGKMFDLNATIRKFQQSVASASYEAVSSKVGSQKVHIEDANIREAEERKKDLEDKLAQIISDTKRMEHEFLLEQNFHKQEQKDVDDLKHRIFLIEAVMEGSKELQTTARIEEAYASLCDTLQKKCICPSCDCNNVEILGGVLQKSL
ncbi:hypothetical protein E3N88_41999 [Mikania micrantha]|uniref:Uncharacterized protein n=1 Tax=Mikania micrantha TaxID=192012 RepID=A0A5N6LAE8_9ASTR|nr:hypothetical protein E3N88_44991 [Mikania micrantha]KAD2028390.1 hypothetical protein E3N88_41999 [Mikania micrantha]